VIYIFLITSCAPPPIAAAADVGANCENAVECCVDRAPDEPMDVMCACGATFCFNCKEEAHRPVRGGLVQGVGAAGGQILP
jgi:ariadne-1